MDLVPWEPFDGLSRIQSRINELFDQTFGRLRTLSAPGVGAWYPPVDILESGDAYLIRVELPGMNKEDIHVEFREGAIVVSGERKFAEPAPGVEYRRAERLAGKFMRRFYLPRAIKQEEVKATYRDGVLEIHAPKTDQARARQIAISES
ncbi:MAG TPA: Hsp20/alpha crystallin family protein [Candidatus Acidoferrales bacterium]|nr:Hsp20/alpha crystallin family protein [Candidatus Acidoferrales bacterium]